MEVCHREDKNKFSRHNINIEGGTKLSTYLDGEKTYQVNSMHHQGIRELGNGLTVAARSDDGLVEAFENHSYKYLLGVQWHPESSPNGEDYLSSRIFDDFLKAIK